MLLSCFVRLAFGLYERRGIYDRAHPDKSELPLHCSSSNKVTQLAVGTAYPRSLSLISREHAKLASILLVSIDGLLVLAVPRSDKEITRIYLVHPQSAQTND